MGELRSRQSGKAQSASPMLEQAVAWHVRLSDSPLDADEQAQYRQWLAADPAHAQALERVAQRLGHAVQPLKMALAAPDSGLRQTFLKPARTRRHFLGKLCVAGGVGGVALWLVDHSHAPVAGWLADYASPTATRRHFTLPDGSQMLLDARSQVDLAFSGQWRDVHLRTGALYIQVAQDADRPLRVHTEEGLVQALGTRFAVRQEDGFSTVAVEQHSVRVQPRAGAHHVLRAGQGINFRREGVDRAAREWQSVLHWKDGILEVHNRPLGEVAAALRPYYPGILRVEPRAAAIRVSGVFSLDDPQRTLLALVHTTPIRLTQYSRWISVIEHL